MQQIEILKSIVEEYKNNAVDIVKRRLDRMLPEHLIKLEEEIRTNGFTVVEDFMTVSECEEIKTWIDYTLSTNGKIWKDAVESDHRIFFANTAFKKINDFYTDEMIINVLSSYEKTPVHSGFTLANKVIYKKDNAGSGGGWHRDFVKRKQTKAILYLNDVNDRTGPFQFIMKTHLFSNIVKFQREFGFKYNQFRFTSDDIARIVKRYPNLLVDITGRAGTLLLVDTRGIHRGKPIEEGVRYALTNYFWFGGAIPAHIRKHNPF